MAQSGPTTNQETTRHHSRIPGLAGIQLGGVDPSIVRELSGVYKPFPKAFKELVSNAFDADADQVTVRLADDLHSIAIEDDGLGMTPFEFRSDFTRIGGGSRKWLNQRTRKGRRRIGSKGIGFLALARYCSGMQIRSMARRTGRVRTSIGVTPARINLDKTLGVPIPSEILEDRLQIAIDQDRGRVGSLEEGRHFRLDAETREVVISRRLGRVVAELSLSCAGLMFEAILDFDRLLELADRADLEHLDDFATMRVWRASSADSMKGTRITALGLRDFVRAELRRPRRKGNVRNVASQAGFDAFVWHLSQSAPIRYDEAICTDHPRLAELLRADDQVTLTGLRVISGKTTHELRRRVYAIEPDASKNKLQALVPVEIDDSGLEASGFLAGYSGVIFPAEYRGITVRVRGIAIGRANYFGAEQSLTGANRAALSQITGEINVVNGLDAVDALNPGRESFYEENEHYKVLQQYILGDSERVSGLLGETIGRVLVQSQVRSSLKDALGRAALRRRVLDDVSAAITDLISDGGRASTHLRRFLDSSQSHANGLVRCKDIYIGPPNRIGGLKVHEADGLSEPAVVDLEGDRIQLDVSRPDWDWTVVLFKRRVEIINKRGKPGCPVAEVDLRKDRILVNWEHPIRSQMDERSFLRTALAWTLARSAAGDDPDVMMDLALYLLAFRTNPIGGSYNNGSTASAV